MHVEFPPTSAALNARLARVRPTDYARTRNHLEGAVTGLSPWITHGFITLREVADAIGQTHALNVQHKLIYELGWRAWFRHVWITRGDGILQSLHPGPLPDAAYHHALPDDCRAGTTGVPVVDQAVAALYRDGWLHNHARMWLASYLVHVRKVHWRVGADWLYGHLLDGDLASNHLSWQWVAGTGSTKPYLFNADNVARYAPPAWHSPGTVIDTGYDRLDVLARTPPQVRPSQVRTPRAREAAGSVGAGRPPEPLAPIDPTHVHGRPVWLLHAWSLRTPPADLPPETRVVGIIDTDFHARWPFSEARWRFVLTRMRELTDTIWCGSRATLADALAGAARLEANADPHLGVAGGLIEALPGCAWRRETELFPATQRTYNNFSTWWRAVTADVTTLDELLAHSARATV
jgi:deoxyribodipyrimidine photo-lyase